MKHCCAFFEGQVPLEAPSARLQRRAAPPKKTCDWSVTPPEHALHDINVYELVGVDEGWMPEALYRPHFDREED